MGEAFTRQVREPLASHGVRTWTDQDEIPIGVCWPDAMRRGLAGSDMVIESRPPDAASQHVTNELDWALQRAKRLALLMTRATAIPHRFVSINVIDATTERRAVSFGLGHVGAATSGGRTPSTLSSLHTVTVSRSADRADHKRDERHGADHRRCATRSKTSPTTWLHHGRW